MGHILRYKQCRGIQFDDNIYESKVEIKEEMDNENRVAINYGADKVEVKEEKLINN